MVEHGPRLSLPHTGVPQVWSRRGQRGRSPEGSSAFSELSQRQLRQIAKDFRKRLVPADSLLTKQGEMSGVAFFVIAEGEAAVIVDGRQVGTMGPGDHFGELAMITERERTATVEALTPMRCYTIQFWRFRAFAKKNPDVTWKLLQHVAGILLTEQSRHAG